MILLAPTMIKLTRRYLYRRLPAIAGRGLRCHSAIVERRLPKGLGRHHSQATATHAFRAAPMSLTQ